MDLLRQVTREVRGLDAREFERLYEGFYLLGEVPLEDGEELEPPPVVLRAGVEQRLSLERQEAIPGRARQAERPTERVPRVAREAPIRRPSEAALWRVQKSDRNGWRRRISLGRAPDNDIVIPHLSVSKLHAHFHGGTLVRLSPLHNAELLLSDAGSVNGTVLGGRRLLSGEAEPVFSGNRILFGEVSCEVLSAAALYTRLRGPQRPSPG